jgi:hypothetical protein
MKPWNAPQTRSIAADWSSASPALVSDDPEVTAPDVLGVADSVELMGPLSDSPEALDDDDCWGAGTLNDNFLDPKCSH